VLAEGLADLFASPAHPDDRGLRVVAELLCHSVGAALLAECADGLGDGLPDLLGTGVFTAL